MAGILNDMVMHLLASQPQDPMTELITYLEQRLQRDGGVVGSKKRTGEQPASPLSNTAVAQGKGATAAATLGKQQQQQPTTNTSAAAGYVPAPPQAGRQVEDRATSTLKTTTAATTPQPNKANLSSGTSRSEPHAASSLAIVVPSTRTKAAFSTPENDFELSSKILLQIQENEQSLLSLLEPTPIAGTTHHPRWTVQLEGNTTVELSDAMFLAPTISHAMKLSQEVAMSAIDFAIGHDQKNFDASEALRLVHCVEEEEKAFFHRMAKQRNITTTVPAADAEWMDTMIGTQKELFELLDQSEFLQLHMRGLLNDPASCALENRNPPSARVEFSGMVLKSGGVGKDGGSMIPQLSSTGLVGSLGQRSPRNSLVPTQTGAIATDSKAGGGGGRASPLPRSTASPVGGVSSSTNNLALDLLQSIMDGEKQMMTLLHRSVVHPNDEVRSAVHKLTEEFLSVGQHAMVQQCALNQSAELLTMFPPPPPPPGGLRRSNSVFCLSDSEATHHEISDLLTQFVALTRRSTAIVRSQMETNGEDGGGGATSSSGSSNATSSSPPFMKPLTLGAQSRGGGGGAKDLMGSLLAQVSKHELELLQLASDVYRMEALRFRSE